MNNKKVQKEPKILQSFCVCLLISFTFCIFGPLDLYYSNINEFWFSLNDLVISLLPVFLVVFSLLLVLFLVTKGKLHQNLLAIVFGLGIATYLQGNYMVVNYGNLNGQEIDWGQYKIWSVFNTLIWLICIILPLVFLRMKRVKSSIYKKTITFIPVFILSIQIVTLSVLFISNNGKSDNVKNSFYLSGQGKFNLSKEENVVVFVLDTFDAGLFSEVISEYPEYMKKFVGFTYFENTLGTYPRTRGAMPFILTNQYNINEMKFSDYIKDSFEKTEFYRDLNSYGFDTRIYTSTSFIDGRQNAVIQNIVLEKPTVSSYGKLSELMYRLTAYRYMPHVLKKNFWMYSGDFDQLKTYNRSKEKTYQITGPDGQYSSDYNFYQEMLDKGVKCDSDQKAFRLYHLNGAHVPFTIDRNIQYAVKKDATEIEQALGVLNIVCEYLDQLREIGLYDNTTFVVLADHGYRDMSQNPMLMVKRPNVNTPFSISRAPVSLEDLHATIMQQITDDYSRYGRSAFDIPEQESRIRRFLLYPWIDDSNQDFLLPLTEYFFSGAANDITSAFKTGRVYTENGIVHEEKPLYTLGKELFFDNEAQQYFEYGICDGDENGFAWSIGLKSKIAIPLKIEQKHDLKVYFGVASTLGNQRVIAYANDQYLGQKDVDSSFFSFTIPQEYLINDLLQIELEYPNAQTPNRINPDAKDYRTIDISFTIAISYKSMKIDVFKIHEFADNKMIIEFNKDGNCNDFIDDGWWEQEEHHRWASKEASFIFKTDTPQDIKLSIDYFSFAHSGETVVYYNDNEIDILSANDNEKTIILPAKYYNEKGVQKVSFKTPKAVSPQNVNANKDTRVLGVGVKKIILEKVNENSSMLSFSDDSLLIDFSNVGNNEFYLEDGWWEQEEHHRWAGKEASFAFKTDTSQDIRLSIDYFSFAYSGETVVYYNDNEIDILSANDNEKTIILPAKYYNEKGVQKVSFKTPKAVSPKSVNANNDTRDLGIGVIKIALEKVKRE